MNKEIKEIVTIETIPEVIDFGNLQYNLDEYTILHYIEMNDWEEDEEGKDVPKSYELSANFFGLHYTALIYQIDIDRDSGNIYTDGPSILHGSFTDNIEENHWNLIVELIKKLREQYENN